MPTSDKISADFDAFLEEAKEYFNIPKTSIDSDILLGLIRNYLSHIKYLKDKPIISDIILFPVYALTLGSFSKAIKIITPTDYDNMSKEIIFKLAVLYAELIIKKNDDLGISYISKRWKHLDIMSKEADESRQLIVINAMESIYNLLSKKYRSDELTIKDIEAQISHDLINTIPADESPNEKDEIDDEEGLTRRKLGFGVCISYLAIIILIFAFMHQPMDSISDYVGFLLSQTICLAGVLVLTYGLRRRLGKDFDNVPKVGGHLT